ncbi:MAG: hypothetical protein NC408_09205 [Candidatus Gastranaerophilales bacterium]|nr:hypothetical protein [Candidatus Gastranaerophilales bacterium]MCM1073000.1 hypothetical protein [Bacteroides sp.]
MIDELRLNTKLLGYDGVISRRDFAINIIYLCMINVLFTTPLMWHYASAAETMFDFFAFNKLFLSAPALLVIWVLLGTIGVLCVSLSNWIRRLNDINGFVNQTANIVIGFFAVLGAFSFLLPFGAMLLISCINSVIFLVLLFKKGKITGKLPYDFRKDFNWGAFFGTWIWGIINKSYHTFWIWVLSCTPAGFYYQLLCGLKGNEWAYKNRKWNSDSEFKTSQEKQTIAFVVLSLIVVPVLIFVLTMVIVFAIAFTAVDETKTSPNGESKTMNTIEKVLNSYTSLYFESHTLTKDENKFYVLPKDWNGYSFSEKKDVLDMAATMSATERSKNGKHSSKTKELSRTKIYSSTNGELLGEFVMDESVFENEKPDFKQIIKASMQAYRFYRARV